jgi:poly(A) polymerase
MGPQMVQIKGDWLTAAPLQAVLSCLTEGGHQAFLVGGAVRNALLGQPVADIDIATDAAPLRVTALASAAGLRVVPTGFDHGTVTVIVDGVPHEVTTFRRDVATDGRRAVVAFSDQLAEDAARRDFTINALYADAAGAVTDPVGGLADIAARRVRFVGNPSMRIREDYLRVLRFFRFFAWYGDPAQGIDAEGLAACTALSAGTETLSRERIGSELRKLLAAPDPAPAVAAMQSTGILARVLPGSDAQSLAVLVHLEDGVAADWRRRLALLGGAGVGDALRLSRDEDRHVADLRACALNGQSAGEIAYRLGSAMARDAGLIRSALTGRALPPDWAKAAQRGAAAVFPVSAADLMPALQGRALGARLRDLETRWIASGFELSREQLLG